MLLLDEDGWYVEGYVWIDDNQPRVQLSIFYTVGDRDGPVALRAC